MDLATLIVIILAIAFGSFVVYLAIVSRRDDHEKTRIEETSDNLPKKGRR